MDREEIRKKWKNRELAEISQKKLSRNNQVNQIQSKPISSWERVQNTANNILQREQKSKFDNFKTNISAIANNFGLGVLNSFVDLGYFLDRQTYRNSAGYKNISKNQEAKQERKELQQKIKSGSEVNNAFLPTSENLQNTQPTNAGLLLSKNNKESTAFQKGADKFIAQNEQTMTDNINSTTNRVARKVAELTPSIAQSTTGMAISALNPVLRNRILFRWCWWRIYTSSFSNGI